MQLLLQFGHGMIDHTKTLLRAWGDGGVILSPRDLTPEQIVRVGREVREMGREVLVDPQCFAHDADHPRLLSHDHFRAFSDCGTKQLFTLEGAREVIRPLVTCAREIGAERLVVPGLLACPVSEEWLKLQSHLIQVAGREGAALQLVATVALDSDSVRDEEAVEAVVDAAADWRIPAVYVVAEAPSQYLVDDPAWLANVLLLVSGLKLQKKAVILGYANHQLLSAAAANVDCIASGTWLNVRAFPIDKFYQPAEDEESRRTTWFYCPQSLSEYKLPFLDIAKRVGVLSRMRPPAALGSTHANALFGAADPGAVNWREPDAFRHYLTCLHGQCAQVTAGSFDQALSRQKALLDDAAAVARGLASRGVRGDYRDFAGYFDANYAALAVLEHARGARLRREW
jgi:hypothetical protein